MNSIAKTNLLDAEKLSIPKFRGQNFEFWKFKLNVFLEAEGLDYTLRPDTRSHGNFVADDARTRMHILEAVDDEHVEHIMGESSARAMVAKLRSMYSTSSSAPLLNPSSCKRRALRDELLNLKMADSEDAQGYLREFEGLAEQLAEYGERLSPKELFNCLLLSMPKSYRHIFDEIDPELTAQQSLDLAKAKILLEYAKRLGCSNMQPLNRSSWKAFKDTFKDEVEECHRCGQTGHWARKCPQSKQCYKCGKRDHLIIQCPLWLPSVPSPPVPNPPVSSPVRSSPVKSSPVMNSPVKDSPMRSSSPAADAKESESICWILDSCATYHTICDETLFSKCVTLKEPISVEVANGNTLSTSKMGEVKLVFGTGNRRYVKVLKDVYLVEQFEQNLLSVQRLVQFGGSVVFKSSEVELRNASNELVTVGKRIQNLYVLKSYPERQ